MFVVQLDLWICELWLVLMVLAGSRIFWHLMLEEQADTFCDSRFTSQSCCGRDEWSRRFVLFKVWLFGTFGSSRMLSTSVTRVCFWQTMDEICWFVCSVQVVRMRDRGRGVRGGSWQKLAYHLFYVSSIVHSFFQPRYIATRDLAPKGQGTSLPPSPCTMGVAYPWRVDFGPCLVDGRQCRRGTLLWHLWSLQILIGWHSKATSSEQGKPYLWSDSCTDQMCQYSYQLNLLVLLVSCNTRGLLLSTEYSHIWERTDWT